MCRIKVTRLEDARHSQTRRRILIEKRGHRCEICGRIRWNTKLIPLEIDHVDGNSDNNNDKNLRLVCPNCHALTPNYKGKNKLQGSARQKMRRQRYREGKTY